MSKNLASIAPVSTEGEKRLAYIRQGRQQGALSYLSEGSGNHGASCFEAEFDADGASLAFVTEMRKRQPVGTADQGKSG